MDEDEWDAKVEERVHKLNGANNTDTYIERENLIDELVERDYLVHDNGGRPFKVVVKIDGISIYTYANDHEMDNHNYSKKLLDIPKFEGFWDGFDSTPHKMHGNSILIKLNMFEYIYVGNEIYRFRTNENILDYISPLGNNDVPYPISIGSKSVYFMLDKKFIIHEEIETKISVGNAEKLYGEFFGFIGYKKHYKCNMGEVEVLVKRL